MRYIKQQEFRKIPELLLFLDHPVLLWVHSKLSQFQQPTPLGIGVKLLSGMFQSLPGLRFRPKI